MHPQLSKPESKGVVVGMVDGMSFMMVGHLLLQAGDSWTEIESPSTNIDVIHKLVPLKNLWGFESYHLNHTNASNLVLLSCLLMRMHLLMKNPVVSGALKMLDASLKLIWTEPFLKAFILYTALCAALQVHIMVEFTAAILD